jgi:hypothetical protein
MHPLIEHLADRWPPSARAASPAVVREVLRAVAPRLGPESWRSLAAIVGEDALRDAELEPTTLATLEESVGEAAGVPGKIAVELTQMVVIAIGAALDPDARRRLAGELSVPWSTMLADRPASTIHATPAQPAPSGPRTLAAGHVGSDHPVSSAAPRRAQVGSVVSEDDPHADRKLATAGEPSGRTLATARTRRG